MKNKIIKIKKVNLGNDLPLTLIAGPCQIESKDHSHMIASKIKEITSKLKIGFIFKSSFDKANRTSLNSKRGVGLDKSLSIFDYISKNNFHQYEISNFAKNKESESKHNYGYWQHKEYLGVGAGAVGYVNQQRHYPLKSIEEYIKNPLVFEVEEIDLDDVKTEKILLGFRSLNGVEISLFNEEEMKKIDDLIQYNKVYIENDRVFNKNFLLSDELALYILD